MNGHPLQQPREYGREGTAKLLTLFHPSDGQIFVKGVRRTTNVILHAWLSEQLLDILATLPPLKLGAAYVERLRWEMWRDGLLHTVTWPLQLPVTTVADYG